MHLNLPLSPRRGVARAGNRMGSLSDLGTLRPHVQHLAAAQITAAVITEPTTTQASAGLKSAAISPTSTSSMVKVGFS